MELMLPSTPKQLSSNGSWYAVASTVLDLGTIEEEVDSTSSCAPDRPRMFLILLTDAEVEGEVRVEKGEVLEGLIVGVAGEEDHDSLGVYVCVCVCGWVV